MQTLVTHLENTARRDLRVEAGMWLRAHRDACGLSQRELAHKVGAIYYTFVSQIEAGRGRIPPDRYAAWAKALHIDQRTFAIHMLRFYESSTHALIFETEIPGDQTTETECDEDRG